MQRQIKKWMSEHVDMGTKLLQRLVQERSIRGHEYNAQAVMIEKCRELGLELDIWDLNRKELEHHAFFRCDRDSFEGNPNICAVWKGKGGGRSIILNGHIDVVPEGDEKDWRNDPYSGMIKDGKLYGRGSTDMKGGSVSLLLAIQALKELDVTLRGDVIFQSVIEEESGGAGTLAALLRGYKADGAIIPEPTNMKMFIKQQGSMWFRITIKGKSAHGGTRYEGVNAIEKSLNVISALQNLETIRNDRINDPLFKDIPIPIPINIGKINSGSWPSSVPDTAIIEGRMGVAPSESMEAAEKEMEECLASIINEDEWLLAHPPKLEWFGGRWQPGDLDINHPFLDCMENAYSNIYGVKPVIEASPWGTDGGILSKGGDIPVVVFGPGTTEAAHEANEFIELKKVFEAAEVIALAIWQWCK
ncbi:peptidase [Falsibacillus pallidus]|uniref:4-acetamidobutyryl-CoA deacetylase n=1 Tax=Falsibacillus pallidus TaxID=493781 RepID=A0A370GHG9_9BACI|nr:4-acetamidobutyryl-CoA deacetylase [Falsibacillus pallidus]